MEKVPIMEKVSKIEKVPQIEKVQKKVPKIEKIPKNNQQLPKINKFNKNTKKFNLFLFSFLFFFILANRKPQRMATALLHIVHPARRLLRAEHVCRCCRREFPSMS